MMNGETENNAGAKFIGILSLGIATWGIYNLFFKKEKKASPQSGNLGKVKRKRK